MGKFWKQAVGGQVQTGVYQASPRHASKQYGSFKTGRPPRQPFQYVIYLEINPVVLRTGFQNIDPMSFSALAKSVDMPSVTFSIDKKNSYNKIKPIIQTKDFKGFSLSVYDDIESRWYALWQHYYNYHFMDGRFDNIIDTIDIEGRDRARRAGIGDVPTYDVSDNSASDDLTVGPVLPGFRGTRFNSDRHGPDIHSKFEKNYIDAIHVFQIHGQTATRTTAINPILADMNMTQQTYEGGGTANEITFNIEFETLSYSPVLNFQYDEDDILKDLIEDVTKAPVFDPAQDKLKGLVKGLFGLEQSNLTEMRNNLHHAERDFGEGVQNISLERESNGLTSGGFFSNLISSAINQKIDEATGDLFKKNNKNINKLNFT